MDNKEVYCKGYDCPHVKRIDDELRRLEAEVKSNKEYSNGRFDELQDLKERMIRLEVLFEEKFNQLEKILSQKNNTWLVILGQIISPLIVAIAMYFIMKR